MQATVAKEFTYGSSYNESVAYDLSRFDRRRSVREALENEPTVSTHGEQRVRDRVAKEAEAKSEAKANRVRISAFAVISYVAIFALFLMIVMNYMRLNEISVTASRRADELAALQSEAAVLQVRYEQKQNITDIKSRAAELGLYAPTSAQINYIDLRQPDYAIVYTQEEGAGAFVTGLYKLAASIGNIFE